MTMPYIIGCQRSLLAGQCFLWQKNRRISLTLWSLYNTGFATVGIHPAVPALLNYAIVVGTQIKMDMPGKASTIALVDTIEPPIVRLDDGKVIQVTTVEQAERIRSHVSKILYLGDMLISYGDFLENNACHLQAERNMQQLRSKLLTIQSSDLDRKRLIQMAENPLVLPSVDEAFEISKNLDWHCIPDIRSTGTP